MKKVRKIRVTLARYTQQLKPGLLRALRALAMTEPRTETPVTLEALNGNSRHREPGKAWRGDPVFSFPMRIVSLLLIIPFLSNCSIYDQSFDCEAGKGVGCKPISEINDLINQGTLDAAIEKTKCPNCKEEGEEGETTDPSPILPDLLKYESDSLASNQPLPLFPAGESPPMPLITQAATISRLPEETLRIWIAPFEDKSGDFQGESFIHTVIKSGRWNPHDRNPGSQASTVSTLKEGTL